MLSRAEKAKSELQKKLAAKRKPAAVANASMPAPPTAVTISTPPPAVSTSVLAVPVLTQHEIIKLRVASFSPAQVENIRNKFRKICLAGIQFEQDQHDAFISYLKKKINYPTHSTIEERISKETIRVILTSIVHLKFALATIFRQTKHDCIDLISLTEPMTENGNEFQSMYELGHLLIYSHPQALILNVFDTLETDYTLFKKRITTIDLDKELIRIFPALAEPRYLKKKKDLIEKIRNLWSLICEYSDNFLVLTHSLHIFANMTDCSKKLTEWQNTAIINMFQNLIDALPDNESSNQVQDLKTITSFELKWLKQTISGSEVTVSDLKEMQSKIKATAVDTWKSDAKGESKAPAKQIKYLSFPELCANGNLHEVETRIESMKNNPNGKKIKKLKSKVKKNNDFLLGLYHACEQGHITVVMSLLKNIIFDQDINFSFSEKNRKNCLMIAAEKNHIDIIKLLLEQSYIQPEKALTSTKDVAIQTLLQEKISSGTYRRLASDVHVVTTRPAVSAVEDKSDFLKTEIETIHIYFDNAKKNILQLETDLETAQTRLLLLQSLLEKDINHKGKAGRFAILLTAIKTKIKTDVAALQAIHADYQEMLPHSHDLIIRLHKNHEQIYLKLVMPLSEITSEINHAIKQHTPIACSSPAPSLDEKKTAAPAASSGLMSSSAFWHREGHTITMPIDSAATPSRETPRHLYPVRLGDYFPQATPGERTAYFAGLLQQFIAFDPGENLILKAMQMDAILRFLTIQTEDLSHIAGLETLKDYKAVRNGLIHRDKLCLGMQELEFFDINKSRFKAENIDALNKLQIRILTLAQKVAAHLALPSCAELKAAVETDLLYRETVKQGHLKHADRFSDDEGYCYALKIKNKQLQYQNEIIAQRLPKDSVLHKMHEYAQEMTEIRGNICAKRAHAEDLFGDTRAMRHTPSVVLPASPASSVALSRSRCA